MSVLHLFWIVPLLGILGFLILLGVLAANREDE